MNFNKTAKGGRSPAKRIHIFCGAISNVSIQPRPVDGEASLLPELREVLALQDEVISPSAHDVW